MKLTLEIFKQAIKGCNMEYEYSIGGYPTSGGPRYNYENLIKAKNNVSKLTNLTSVLKRAAVIKLVFGKSPNNGPYEELLKRAKDLKATDEQLASIESVEWEDYKDIKKHFFPEFKW